jgi:hypothetical protein
MTKQYLNKYTSADLEQYVLDIMEQYNNNKVFQKKQGKVENEEIPDFKDHRDVISYNYNLNQLKIIAKYYKLKVTGNKTQLTSRIHTHLYLSFFILKIQKIARGYLQKKYNKAHGPAFMNRALCINPNDFFTMDTMSEISFEQFFSFKDDDNFIYGFDLVSIHNLMQKCDGIIKNPYNRRPLSQKVIESIKYLIKLSKLLRITISVEIKNIELVVSNEKSVELRTLTLFQNIDALGNYSDPSWFMSLNNMQLIRLLRELVDIWGYRAQLSMEIKRSICPPSGDPFNRIHSFVHLQTLENIDELRKIVLTILEKFVNSGLDREYQILGSYYVLGAITLVNTDAANSPPWLYQSLVYHN